jgi:hypothetical protein
MSRKILRSQKYLQGQSAQIIFYFSGKRTDELMLLVFTSLPTLFLRLKNILI